MSVLYGSSGYDDHLQEVVLEVSLDCHENLKPYNSDKDMPNIKKEN